MTPHKPIAFIRKLMKGKSNIEIQEAEERFHEYLALVKKITERVHKEKENNS